MRSRTRGPLLAQASFSRHRRLTCLSRLAWLAAGAGAAGPAAPAAAAAEGAGARLQLLSVQARLAGAAREMGVAVPGLSGGGEGEPAQVRGVGRAGGRAGKRRGARGGG